MGQGSEGGARLMLTKADNKYLLMQETWIIPNLETALATSFMFLQHRAYWVNLSYQIP